MIRTGDTTFRSPLALVLDGQPAAAMCLWRVTAKVGRDTYEATTIGPGTSPFDGVTRAFRGEDVRASLA